MRYVIASLLMLAVLGIVACGGQENSVERSAPPVAQSPKPAQTSQIIAERDFSFNSSKKITLSVEYSVQGKGAFHVYYKAAHVSSEGLVIGDPTSRITTIYPEQDQVVEIEVNSNWSSLYIHWVPMSVYQSELTLAIPLNQASDHYHITF
ncbi:hypothetical protein [Vibrio sagamiensis]|uniref:Lipoprotein n=1 Tax=Vibrio sagamiensis NBRC 104589 TaxID=1219064 RepID=A0A511QBW4_9VIBR|nr:hypothetical protein [Vibrio sagamiensis]PNQ71785.1 hypothetical protein C1141_00870 [Vibrio agarivorans]GEM74793.1 hypothetical protein VSA01S_09050 [Vibrio sagamiensis NBRC 104589]